jgi:hypothetical protein
MAPSLRRAGSLSIVFVLGKVNLKGDLLCRFYPRLAAQLILIKFQIVALS